MISAMGVSVFDLRLILRLRRAGILQGKFELGDIGAQQLGNEVLRHRRILPALGRAFDAPARDQQLSVK